MDAEALRFFERRAYELSEAGTYERDYTARQEALRAEEGAKRVESYISGLGLGDMIPTPAEYDYAAMLADGVVPKADPMGRVPLPPQYWKPGRLVVRGVDLATGERVGGGPSLEDMLMGVADDGASLIDAELTPADLEELDLPARNSLEAWMQTRGMQVVAGPAQPMDKPSPLARSGRKPGGSGVGAAEVGTAMLDMLAGALKGATAQTLGLPGDIESLVRMLTGGEQVLPTTEDVAAMLPPVVPDGNPDRTHTADTFQTLGEFGPLPSVGGAAVRGAAKVGKELAPVAGKMAADAVERAGVPVRGLAAVPSEGVAADPLAELRAAWKARGISLDAYSSSARPDVITLSRLEVPKAERGRGTGSEAMQALVQYADQAGKTIALSPSTDFGGSSVARLKKFYKQFGFVENKGRNRDYEISETMYRRPVAGDTAGAKP